jgi:transcription initiation factor TFIID subunit 13
VLDEMVTDFIQSVSFDATRAAHHSGRQKVKFEDFEFAMRRNSRFVGKIHETFEKKKDIESAKKIFDESVMMRDTDRDEKQAEKATMRGTKRPRPAEEELGGGDDDVDAEADIGTAPKRR